MNFFDVLKAAEEKMDRALLAYSKSKLTSSDFHKSSIEDLRKATIEFLELRVLILRGQEPASLSLR
jgi:hypothetical protein